MLRTGPAGYSPHPVLIRVSEYGLLFIVSSFLHYLGSFGSSTKVHQKTRSRGWRRSGVYWSSMISAWATAVACVRDSPVHVRLKLASERLKPWSRPMVVAMTPEGAMALPIELQKAAINARHCERRRQRVTRNARIDLFGIHPLQIVRHRGVKFSRCANVLSLGRPSVQQAAPPGHQTCLLRRCCC